MRLERDGEIALLRLEAGRANAIGDALLDGLDALLDELERGDARAAIVTGYARYFSAGLDLPSLVGRDRASMHAFIHRFDQVMLRVFACERPVVAAVNGHAIAGGCVLALQADYRVMAGGDARIGLNETQLGIGLPAGVLETLRFQVSATTLLLCALEGKLFLPEEARGHGLVDEVVPPQVLEARAVDKARELGAIPAAAWAQVKTALRAPVIQRIRAIEERERERWLDTWFTDEARRRIGDAVGRIGKKG